MSHLVSMATSTEVRQSGAKLAVLPVGSFEQHGEFLPLSTDTIIASVIARKIAATHDLFLLPPITVSCSHEHAAWSGTVSICARTLTLVIEDIAESLRRSGVHRLALVNGHGGNYVLQNIVQEANVTKPRMTLFPDKEDWKRARQDAELRSSSHEDMHAGELETSILLHAMPEAIRDGNGSGDADHVADDRRFLLVKGLKAYTDSGVVGRPSLGTADKGKTTIESLTRSFSEHLRALGC